MRLKYLAFAFALMILALPALSWADSYVIPTTTLSALTANNTSAANGFLSQPNGNRGAGNISKGDIHSLLYSGATTKVYAHLLLWFGESKHMNIGYSSTDPAQIQRQIDDMVSRGIDGVIIDWYGPNNAIDQATQLVMAEAEKHTGFTFAIMIDEGALEWDSCAGCSPQQALTSQLEYIEQTYFPSPAYMTEQGHPVITNFNLDLLYTIDWDTLNADLSTHPYFLFQNNNGFGHPLSGGSYAWVMPTTTDYGMNYLSSFYKAGAPFPNEQTVGAAYKGFNDSLASWGSDRIMGQQCGETWLQTFSEINGIYSSGKQLAALQLVTWNDYEEATEIESGIDNCLTVSASVAANALQWTGTGNENTVDHYAVYISSDGQNLMSLTDMAAGIHSLNLCSFPITSGNYKLFVQAVGKPSVANQITSALSYSPSCSQVTQPPSFSLSASPSSLTIPAGRLGKLTVTATPQSGSFSNPISFSCAGLPETLTCSFSPATVTPGSGPATSTLTLTPVSVSAMDAPGRRKSNPHYGSWLLGLGIAGFAFLGNRPSRRRLRALSICAFLGLGMIASSCGGKSAGIQDSPAAFAVTINGNSASSDFSTTVNVTIN
jgi:hypothetical protein